MGKCKILRKEHFKSISPLGFIISTGQEGPEEETGLNVMNALQSYKKIACIQRKCI
jgi:hypothetical protein